MGLTFSSRQIENEKYATDVKKAMDSKIDQRVIDMIDYYIISSESADINTKLDIGITPMKYAIVLGLSEKIINYFRENGGCEE